MHNDFLVNNNENNWLSSKRIFTHKKRKKQICEWRNHFSTPIIFADSQWTTKQIQKSNDQWLKNNWLGDQIFNLWPVRVRFYAH